MEFLLETGQIKCHGKKHLVTKHLGEKCQCNVGVVWAEGMGNLPPTNLPPRTALVVTCVSVQKGKKKDLKISTT